jgi:hypothetical protein
VAALGIVALVRTELRDTWYTPVVDVANINHITWSADVVGRAGRDRSGVSAGGCLAAQPAEQRSPPAPGAPVAERLRLSGEAGHERRVVELERLL